MRARGQARRDREDLFLAIALLVSTLLFAAAWLSHLAFTPQTDVFTRCVTAVVGAVASTGMLLSFLAGVSRMGR